MAFKDCVGSAKVGSKCISVNGKMTVYFAGKSALGSRLLSVNRYTLDLSQAMSDISTSINQIIDSGMKSGQFLSVSSDIQGITYVGSGSSQQPQVKQSYRFPTYGYPLIVLSIVAITAMSFVLLKLVKKRFRQPSSPTPDDIENARMSDDDIKFISDDGVVAKIVDNSPGKSKSSTMKRFIQPSSPTRDDIVNAPDDIVDVRMSDEIYFVSGDAIVTPFVDNSPGKSESSTTKRFSPRKSESSTTKRFSQPSSPTPDDRMSDDIKFIIEDGILTHIASNSPGKFESSTKRLA